MISYPNAKINIGLNIVEKRQDGYHNIETVFYPIPLVDTLQIVPSESCTDYNFSSSGIVVDGDSEENLVVKSYRLLQREFPLPPIDIALHKQIPFGAGLGGGSADAAFALKLLNEQFALALSDEELEQRATTLGADCPVFIRNKPVFATGIGDVFTPLPSLSLSRYWLLLVKPPIAIPTPLAYAKVSPKLPEKSIFTLIEQPIEKWKNTIVNDFEESVFDSFPRIKEIKEKMYDLGAVYASMSGSGSSVYGLFEKELTLETADFEDCFVVGGKLN